MKNLHAIEIRFIGPTNTKGARVKLTSCRFNESIIINYDYSKNSIYEIAQEYLESKGFNIIGLAETQKGYMLLSDVFKSIK